MNIERIKLPRYKPVLRRSFILETCKNKRVLHLGCTDSPFTVDRLRDGSLLHLQICEVSERNVGIDIDAEAINLLNENGISDAFVCDAINAGQLMQKLAFTPDIVVVGEILEHLPNPGYCLSNLATFLDPDVSLLVSVPNALFVRSIAHLALGYEKTHPDHVAFYSPVTLHRLLSSSGFVVDRILPYTQVHTGFKQKLLAAIEKLFLWWQPYFSQGLIALAHTEKK